MAACARGEPRAARGSRVCHPGRVRLTAVLALAALPQLAWPQSPGEPIAAPRVTIERFLVEGNTLLTQQDIDRALAPFSGPDKDFGDIQRALEALEQRYRDQ